MLGLEEYTYRIDYIKNDNTKDTVYYTVMALNDDAGRIKAAEKFRIEREFLINST